MEAVKKQEFSKKKFLLCCVCGCLIGLVNGFFGGGGGMICVPLLSKVLNFESKVAHASAIAVIFPISLVSAFVYTINTRVEIFSLLSVSAGVLLGGLLGSVLLKILPEKIVRVIFVFVMLFGGIKLIFWFRKRFFEVFMLYFLLIVAGFVGGIFGGMGMGGGTFLIPILAIFFGFQQKICQELNLISFLIMAIISLIIHHKNGYICTKNLIPIVFFGILFSILGAFLASFVSNELLKISFGIFLCVLAVVEFVKVIKK